MINCKIFYVVCLFFLIYSFSLSQSKYEVEWSKWYTGNGNNNDQLSANTIDDSGNVYVTGGIYVSGARYDFMTIKYNKFGDSLWTARYGDGYNGGADIALDDSGNVYVAGAGPIIKYNRNGNIVLVSENYQVNYKIILDSAGNIYVAGVRWYDYITAKYDRNGNRIWNNTYHFEGQEHLRDMVIDNMGNIIVTGDSQSLTSSYDYATVKYSNNGQQLWVRRYNGTSISSMPYDGAHAVSTDENGNVYVTGVSQGFTGGDNCVTIKYDSSGNELWISRITSATGGFDIGIDGSKNIYIAGRYGGSSYTFKLDSNSNFLWGNTYPSNDGFASNYPKLILDSINKVYVTANYRPTTATHFAFIVYDSTGNQLSFATYNTQFEGYEYVADMALDNVGNVYLSGSSWISGITHYYDYLTIKFSPILTVISSEPDKINEYFLSQNYPNPFNPVTVISYHLSVNSNVNISIYDVLGNYISTLVNENKSPGSYEAVFNASDLPSGIYFYSLSINGKIFDSKRMILLK